MESLTEHFDVETVASLAGSRVFERGVKYHSDGRVARTEIEGGRVVATVKGTMPYSVELWNDDDGQQWSCTCPAAEDGSFCKHAVAVALSIIAGEQELAPSSIAESGRSSGRSANRGPVPDTERDLVTVVEGLSADRLAEIVMQQATSDWRLREILLAEAQSARGEGVDMATWRTRISRTFAPSAYSRGGYVDYHEAPGWAAGVNEVVGALEDLCDTGHHDAAARLAEHAHRCADRAIQHVDDSDGWLTDFSVRLSGLHLQACSAGQSDPADLAARLVELELGSELCGFYRCAAAYGEILGPEGLAAFRGILDERRNQASADDDSVDEFAWHNAMVGWALGIDDPDVLIEAHSLRRPLPEDVLEIARTLDRAGRGEEAVAWARRGLSKWGDRPWQVADLRDFLASKLRDGGEDRAAVELFWQAFVSGPSLAAYRRLLDEDDGQDWLRRCGDHLSDSLTKAARRATPEAAFSIPPPAVSEASAALMEILLYEGRTDEAWKAAHDFGTRAQLWLTLARSREQLHPIEAMSVYEPAALAIIERKDVKQYQSAVDLMARHRRLAESAGEPERFAALLERIRTEHRLKRKLQSLIDAQGW